MESHVCRIWPLSVPDFVHYLHISWETDLGKGFTVTLWNGQHAWSGKVSETQMTVEANEAEMEREKYLAELRQALTSGEGRTRNYSFDISKHGDADEMLNFTYEKVLQDFSFKLGSVELKKVSDPTEVIKELINYGLDCIGDLRIKNEHMQKENKRLKCDCDYSLNELEKHVKDKEALEHGLYSRFILVLNEKKAKIRSLLEKLKCTQEEAEASSESRGVVAASQETPAAKESIDSSANEESKDHTSEYRRCSQPPKPANAPTESHPLDSSLHETVDVAPSRKRRHRQQRDQVADAPKVPCENLSQDKGRSHSANPAPLSSPQEEDDQSLSTIPNTPDPDNLFDHI
ncbi:DNA repair protein XRCC4 isoform X1 [Callorhinchus milii]|uniref:DNA repair protein XRCC4 isoform X1 n=1 Tax=Callorhinchus milii TaxID=7868 RepID=UPI001C3F945A|nr:DNA repair protein XRCC4 isoform X1 [Callorhinchus milii]